MKIAVDAMGGDHAPEIIVLGAVEAAREFDLSLILVGDQEGVSRELAKTNFPSDLIEVCHCAQVAGMDEAPVEVLRHKKDSSIRVAFDLVKSGRAQAVVSAGNSGATLAVGTVVLGRLEGVERPGIATFFPTLKGRTILIDAGANVDCKPSFLRQFAIMARAFSQVVLQIEEPSIGLLSIGEENTKGNDLVRQTYDLLSAEQLNFIGNIEGRDIFSGLVDVVVCDGFVGNVVLKVSEGLAEAMGIMLKEELRAGFFSRWGALLTLGALKRFKKRVDYAEFGGAPLLGLNGVGIISHGGSSPKAIKNAIRFAAELVQGDVTARLQECLRRSGKAAPA